MIFRNRRRSSRRRGRRASIGIGVLVGIAIITAGSLILLIRNPSATSGAPSTAPGPPPPTPTASSGAAMTNFQVYFHQGEVGDPARVVPVDRTVPKTDMVATAALTELLAGPTAAERDAGYWSLFSSTNAQQLRSVRVANGLAHADFHHDLSQLIPNASSGSGSAALLAELDTTLKQFPTVTSTVYSFDGDVAAFYQWVKLEPPITKPGDPAPAIATARQFITEIVGMERPVEGPFRWVGNGIAEVTFYARSPRGEPMEELATVVSLQRSGATQWSVIGTSTPTIVADLPTRMQTISSPLRVSGQAHTFEGTVAVRVLEDRKGAATEIGHGIVTGGGDQMRPFNGLIDFTPPSGGGGWVIFSALSAADGEVILATSVQVGFPGTPAAPTIHDLTWDPPLPVEDGWLRLPAGAGAVTFTVQASAADRVEFFLTPTGTETESLAKLLGEGARTDGGFTLTWNYPDEPVLGHVTVVATGPGGRTELLPFNVYHE